MTATEIWTLLKALFNMHSMQCLWTKCEHMNVFTHVVSSDLTVHVFLWALNGTCSLVTQIQPLFKISLFICVWRWWLVYSIFFFLMYAKKVINICKILWNTDEILSCPTCFTLAFTHFTLAFLQMIFTLHYPLSNKPSSLFKNIREIRLILIKMINARYIQYWRTDKIVISVWLLRDRNRNK